MGAQRKFPGLRAGVLLAAMLATSVAVVSTAVAQSTSTTSEGYLGVTTQTLTDELREGLGFKYAGAGALVNGVMDDSPAMTAGIKQGDIITTIGTKAITSSSTLRSAVRGYKAGQTVSVKVVRAGQTRTLNVKLAEVPDEGEEFDWETPPPTPRAPYAPMPPPAPKVYRFYGGDGDDMGDIMVNVGGRGRLGVRVEELTPELGEYFKVASGKGVLVMSVVDESAAKKAGIKSGDVITKVNDTAIADSDDLVSALRKLDAGPAKVTVVRKGATQVISVTLPEPQTMKMRTPSAMRWYMNDDPHYKRRIEIHGDDQADLHREIEELRREIDDLKRDLSKGDKN